MKSPIRCLGDEMQERAGLPGVQDVWVSREDPAVQLCGLGLLHLGESVFVGQMYSLKISGATPYRISLCKNSW